MTDPFYSLDHATLRHLCEWLDYAVDDQERPEVCRKIKSALSNSPELIAEGKTWQDIANRGE